MIKLEKILKETGGVVCDHHGNDIFERGTFAHCKAIWAMEEAVNKAAAENEKETKAFGRFIAKCKPAKNGKFFAPFKYISAKTYTVNQLFQLYKKHERTI